MNLTFYTKLLHKLSLFIEPVYVSVGKVIMDGRVVNKAGTQVSDKSVIEIKAEIPKYVCR